MATKDQVISVHAANPKWTARQIAAHVGCPADYVRAVKSRYQLPIPTAIKTFSAHRYKLAQGYQVIAGLLGRVGELDTPEGRRALEYFNTSQFDPDFLPWPRAKAGE